MRKHFLNHGINAGVWHSEYCHHVQCQRNHIDRNDEIQVAFVFTLEQGDEIHYNKDPVQKKKNQQVLQGYCAPFCPARVAVFRIATFVVTSYFTVGNVLFQSVRRPFHTFG